MNVKLTKTGTIVLQLESEIEEYAMRTWVEDSMARADHIDCDYILAGTFLIEDRTGHDLIDVFLDDKEKRNGVG